MLGLDNCRSFLGKTTSSLISPFIQTADIFHFLCYCQCVLGKPNQLNNLKCLKTNGWWKNPNSNHLSCVPLLLNTTARATATATEYSGAPHPHAPHKDFHFRKTCWSGIQRSEARLLTCLWKLLRSPTPPTVILCVEPLLRLSMKTCLVWTKLGKLHCNVGPLDMQDRNLPPPHYLTTAPCPSHRSPAFYTIISLAFLLCSRVPTACYTAFPLGTDSNHKIWSGKHSFILYDYQERSSVTSITGDFLTLCSVFSLVSQVFDAPGASVVPPFWQLWVRDGCRTAGRRTWSEGLTGAPWESRMKQSINCEWNAPLPLFLNDAQKKKSQPKFRRHTTHTHMHARTCMHTQRWGERDIKIRMVSRSYRLQPYRVISLPIFLNYSWINVYLYLFSKYAPFETWVSTNVLSFLTLSLKFPSPPCGGSTSRCLTFMPASIAWLCPLPTSGQLQGLCSLPDLLVFFYILTQFPLCLN